MPACSGECDVRACAEASEAAAASEVHDSAPGGLKELEGGNEIGARAKPTLPSNCKGMGIGTEVLVSDIHEYCLHGWLPRGGVYNRKTLKGVHLGHVEFLSVPELVPRPFGPALLAR